MPRPIRDDEREDARNEAAELRGVHPVLKRIRYPEPETARCCGCGIRFYLSGLTDDLLCAECDQAVKDMEKGKI
jgi:hypothetical protein